MKFQNISIHGSRSYAMHQKRDEQTNGQARGNMPPPLPPNFFRWGHKKKIRKVGMCL